MPVDPDTPQVPEIELGLDEQQVGDEAVAALARCTDIFVRYGRLVHVVDNSATGGGVEVVALPEALLRERLSRCASWREGTKPVRVPPWVVRAVAARGRWPGVQRLRAVLTHPVIAPDGTLVTRAGYDPATGAYLAPGGGTVRVPVAPTVSAVRRALVELREIASSLGIVDEKSFAAWLACLMTAQARFAIGGPTPLFVFSPPTSVRGLDLATLTGAILHATPTVPVDFDAIARRPDVAFAALRGDAGLTRIERFATGDAVSQARVLDSLQTDARSQGSVWVTTVEPSVLRPEIRSRVVYVETRAPAVRDGPPLNAGRLDRARIYQRALTILVAHARHGSSVEADGLSFAAWIARVEDALVGVDLPRVLDATEADPPEEGGPQSAVFDAIERMTDPATVRVLLAAIRSPRDEGDRALRAAIEALEPGLLGHPRAPQRLGFLLARLAAEPLGARALVWLGSGMHGNRWIVRSVEPTT